tara:strand:- start:96 stop:308 length:213 start_codon:yes stop_codon:yes gene_type:complete
MLAEYPNAHNIGKIMNILKLSKVGLAIITTPKKPKTMVNNLIKPIFSFKNILERIVIKNGVVKKSAVATA